MSEKSQVKVYLPDELHNLLNADSRSNSEAVEAALWAEYGGEKEAALDRRIEEKKKRISMIESERNERDRELEEERSELNALQAKRDSMVSKETELWEEAVQTITPPDTSHLASVDVDPDEWEPEPQTEGVEYYADKLNITPQEFCQQYQAKRGEYNGE